MKIITMSASYTMEAINTLILKMILKLMENFTAIKKSTKKLGKIPKKKVKKNLILIHGLPMEMDGHQIVIAQVQAIITLLIVALALINFSYKIIYHFKKLSYTSSIIVVLRYSTPKDLSSKFDLFFSANQWIKDCCGFKVFSKGFCSFTFEISLTRQLFPCFNLYLILINL